MRSRFIAELTTPEVEKYLLKKTTTAILPVGCVEMHGPHQPIGTDTMIAKAFGLLIAEGADGLVLPEIHYSWAGSTDGFAGTVSIEPELVQRTVESIAIKVNKMGFRRLLVISVHHGNHYPLFLFARRIYETHQIPAVYINPYNPFNDEAKSIFEGVYEQSKEASIVLAALNVLGQTNLYSETEMRYEKQEAAQPESYRKLSAIGVVGFSMQDTTQHVCPSKYVSLEKGLAYMKKQVQHMLPLLDNIDKYAQDIAAQGNKGWWK